MTEQAAVPNMIGGLTSSRADDILAVAADLFWTHGYDATTTRDLAEGLGLSKPALYHHIENKESILFAICLSSLTRILDAANEVANSMADAAPVDLLIAVIDTHVETALSDRSKHATMLTEMRALSGDHRTSIMALRHRYDQLLEAIIRSAQAADEIRSDLAPRVLRLALLNLLNWTIFWFDPAGELTPGELSNAFATLFLDGARRPENNGETT